MKKDLMWFLISCSLVLSAYLLRPKDALADQCAIDPSTNLMWEIKQPSGIHSLNEKFIWKNYSEAKIDKRYLVKSCSLSDCTSDSFVIAANIEKYCGFSDWRLPTLAELSTLNNCPNGKDLDDWVNYTPCTGWRNTKFSAKVPFQALNTSFWSDEAYTVLKDYAWFWNFAIGAQNRTFKSDIRNVVLVRNAKSSDIQTVPIVTEPVTNPTEQPKDKTLKSLQLQMDFTHNTFTITNMEFK